MSLVDHFWPSVRANPVVEFSEAWPGGRRLKANDLGSLDDALLMFQYRREDIRAGRKPRARLGKAGTMTFQSAQYVMRHHGLTPEHEQWLTSPKESRGAAPASEDGFFTALMKKWFGDDSSNVDWFL